VQSRKRLGVRFVVPPGDAARHAKWLTQYPSSESRLASTEKIVVADAEKTAVGLCRAPTAAGPPGPMGVPGAPGQMTTKPFGATPEGGT
jgi:hypothetical protein